MNTEQVTKELNDELKAIKATYAQMAHELTIYTYDLPIDPTVWFIRKIVTFTTENRSNTIATLEGVKYRRLPYENGAKFYIPAAITFDPVAVKLHSIQPGTITIEDA